MKSVALGFENDSYDKSLYTVCDKTIKISLSIRKFLGGASSLLEMIFFFYQELLFILLPNQWHILSVTFFMISKETTIGNIF